MALPKKYDFNDYDNYLTDANPTTSADAQDYFRNTDSLVGALVGTFLWQPGTNYANGDVVKSNSMPNGTEAVCVSTNGGKSSNVEPQWGNVGGKNVVDGTCFWKLRWKHWSKNVDEIADLTTGATNRLPNTTYNINDVMYHKSNLQVALKCTTAGATSGGEIDVSGKAIGASVTDGGVVWKIIARSNVLNETDVLPIANGGTGGNTFIKSASISGKTITLNMSDGTNKTLTTQDTVPNDYVVSQGVSANGRTYVKWNSGRLQMSGYVAKGATGGNYTVNLPIPLYSTDNVSVTIGVCSESETSYTNFTYRNFGYNSLTTTQLSMFIAGEMVGKSWRIDGRWKE